MAITTARSDKWFKSAAHRAERLEARLALRVGGEPFDRHKLFGNRYWSPKDGRQWVDPNSRWMRK